MTKKIVTDTVDSGGEFSEWLESYREARRAQLGINFYFDMKSFFDQRHYRVNKFFLSGLGIWPEQPLLMRCLLPAMYILSFVSVLIPEVLRIHDMRNHVNIIIETMVPILMIFMVSSKLLNGSFNVRKMRTILGRIEGHWAQMEKTRNIEILSKHGNHSHFITVVFASYIYTCTVVFLILPMMPVFLDIIMPLNESRPKDLLFQAEYRVDHDKYFYEILCHAYFTSTLAMSIIVAVDSMLFTIVEHACGLFEMVGTNIQTVNLSIDRSDNDDYKQICYCIDLHKEALRFAELIESNYSTAFTPVIALSLLALSVSGVQLILNLDNMNDVIRYGMFVVGQMIHILFNSICGQKIFDYSVAISNSIILCSYGSNWINFSIKNKKLLINILIRSQKPCLLTAGKIYILSMASFSSVMQTACSYFTVLTSML